MCNSQAEESRTLKSSCEADLAEALPALESAVSALKSLSKGDIVEASTVMCGFGRGDVTIHSTPVSAT